MNPVQYSPNVALADGGTPLGTYRGMLSTTKVARTDGGVEYFESDTMKLGRPVGHISFQTWNDASRDQAPLAMSIVYQTLADTRGEWWIKAFPMKKTGMNLRTQVTTFDVVIAKTTAEGSHGDTTSLTSEVVEARLIRAAIHVEMHLDFLNKEEGQRILTRQLDQCRSAFALYAQWRAGVAASECHAYYVEKYRATSMGAGFDNFCEATRVERERFGVVGTFPHGLGLIVQGVLVEMGKQGRRPDTMVGPEGFLLRAGLNPDHMNAYTAGEANAVAARGDTAAAVGRQTSNAYGLEIFEDRKIAAVNMPNELCQNEFTSWTGEWFAIDRECWSPGCSKTCAEQMAVEIPDASTGKWTKITTAMILYQRLDMRWDQHGNLSSAHQDLIDSLPELVNTLKINLTGSDPIDPFVFYSDMIARDQALMTTHKSPWQICKYAGDAEPYFLPDDVVKRTAHAVKEACIKQGFKEVDMTALADLRKLAKELSEVPDAALEQTIGFLSASASRREALLKGLPAKPYGYGTPRGLRLLTEVENYEAWNSYIERAKKGLEALENFAKICSNLFKNNLFTQHASVPRIYSTGDANIDIQSALLMSVIDEYRLPVVVGATVAALPPAVEIDTSAFPEDQRQAVSRYWRNALALYEAADVQDVLSKRSAFDLAAAKYAQNSGKAEFVKNPRTLASLIITLQDAFPEVPDRALGVLSAVLRANDGEPIADITALAESEKLPLARLRPIEEMGTGDYSALPYHLSRNTWHRIIDNQAARRAASRARFFPARVDSDAHPMFDLARDSERAAKGRLDIVHKYDAAFPTVLGYTVLPRGHYYPAPEEEEAREGQQADVALSVLLELTGNTGLKRGVDVNEDRPDYFLRKNLLDRLLRYGKGIDGPQKWFSLLLIGEQLTQQFQLALLESDIPPLFSTHLILRPHIRQVTGSILFFISGPETGIMAHDDANIVNSIDGSHGTALFNAHMYLNAVVLQPANFNWVPCATLERYLSGRDAAVFTNPSHYNRDGQLDPTHSIFILLIGNQLRSQIPEPIFLSNRYTPAKYGLNVRQYGDGSKQIMPGMLFYVELWGWHRLHDTCMPIDYENFKTLRDTTEAWFNEICFSGSCRYMDPSRHSFDRFELGISHWKDIHPPLSDGKSMGNPMDLMHGSSKAAYDFNRSTYLKN